jgi:photosystem II PsbZ protein
MILGFQLVCCALIALSFLLTIGIPVSFALPEDLSKYKSFILYGVGCWFVLIALIGILHSFVI